MSDTVTLRIADYSNDPWGRNDEDNAKGLNGASFREKYLLPALEKSQTVIIDFNGLRDYLDSAFLGGVFVDLVKKNGFTYDQVRDRVKIHADFQYYPLTVGKILDLAESEQERLARVAQN